MLKLSVDQQMPFVEAYYEMNGLREDDSPEMVHRITFLPAYARMSDDLVIGQRGVRDRTPGGRKPSKGDPSMHAIWEQNQVFDTDGDGKFTWADFDKVRGG